MAAANTGGMEPDEILQQARDTLTVRRVFGEPIERDGILVVPVARVFGGAGAGSGQEETGKDEDGRPNRRGSGGGWGAVAHPVGVYVISGGNVRWVPALNLNQIILGGQIAAVVGLLVLRSIVRAVRR